MVVKQKTSLSQRTVQYLCVFVPGVRTFFCPLGNRETLTFVRQRGTISRVVVRGTFHIS